MVHRDVKPANIVITGDGVLKILDFGMAMIREGWPSDVAITRPGLVLGTPHYMAPEQIEDSHNVDIRADIYGLGCTFYHLLSGRPPFKGSKFTQQHAHRSADVPPLSQKTGVPDSLWRILQKMLAKEPGDRYATPADVGGAVAPYSEGSDLVLLCEQSTIADSSTHTGRALCEFLSECYPNVAIVEL